MKHKETMDEIRSLRKELTLAIDNKKCVCSGFCLQYEGSCQCGSENEINRLKCELENLKDEWIDFCMDRNVFPVDLI
jgi:hypothetical protein